MIVSMIASMRAKFLRCDSLIRTFQPSSPRESIPRRKTTSGIASSSNRPLARAEAAEARSMNFAPSLKRAPVI
jgi:hypothetical protein